MDEGRLRRIRMRDLHVLKVIVETGSMAKAAPRLAMSQPAVSRVIAELENAIGVPIFDRTSTGVELTAYGEILRRRAFNIGDELKQALAELRHLSDPSQGEIRIGTTEPMTALTSAIVGHMSLMYPKVRFFVWAADTMILHRKLREREVDVAITRTQSSYQDDGDLITEVLFDDELAVIAGRQNKLHERKVLSLRDLMEERWILGFPNTSFLRPLIEEAFSDAGLAVPESTVSCGSYAMQINLVATGPFLTILPEAILQYPRPNLDLAALPVRLPTTKRAIGIVRLRNRSASPVVERFYTLAQKAVGYMSR